MSKLTISYQMARALLRCKSSQWASVPAALKPTTGTIQKLGYKNLVQLDHSRALGWRWRLTARGRQTHYVLNRILDSRGRFIIEGL